MGKHNCESCGSNWNASGYVVCPFCGSIKVD